MHQIRYRITTKDPVIISDGRGDTNVTSSLKYIPGRYILGIFAWNFIRTNSIDTPHMDDDFKDWFLFGKLQFHNGYPALNPEPEIKDIDRLIFYPTPLSLVYEKKNQNENRRVLYDLTVSDREFDTVMKNVNEFSNISGIIKLHSPSMVTNFHFGRGKRNKISNPEKEIFYYEAIDKDQEFEGKIIGKEDILIKFLNNFPSNIQCRIGKSKLTQYGNAILEILDDSPIMANLNENKKDLNNTNEFIITFKSDAIFYDELGNSNTNEIVLKSYLSKLFKIELEKIKISKSFIESKIIEHFVGVWKMKTPSHIAVQAGSVLKCNITDAVNIGSKLLEIQTIGEWNHMGYGEIEIGYQNVEIEEYRSQSSQQDDDKPIVKRPNGEVPNLIRELFQCMAEDYLINKIENQARQKAQEFLNGTSKSKHLSNSLLNQLELVIANKNIITTPNDFLNFIELEVENKDTRKEKLRLKLLQFQNKNDHFIVFAKRESSKFNDFKQNYIQDINVEKKIKTLSEEIGYDFNELKNKFHRQYWITFFRHLKKGEKKL